MLPSEPRMSRDEIWALILRDSIRRIRRELERPEGTHVTRESVAVLRENVARWLDDRPKLA